MGRIVAFAVLFLSACSAIGAECAKYEPASTNLVGKLVLRDYPGPPNYENVDAGDRLERQWILLLRSPLCVDGDSSSDLNSDSVEGVTEVQLVQLTESPSLKPLQGRMINVSGELFSAHTGHHRTPVLLIVRQARSN